MMDSYPHGPDAATHLLNSAHHLGLINLAALGDLSILLLKALLSPASPLRQPVEQEFHARRLHLRASPQLLRLLVASAPLRNLEVLELGRAGDPHQRGVVLDIIFRLYLPALRRFLGRLYLADPSTFDAVAIRLLIQALGRYYRIPPGTICFLCQLYRHVLGSLPTVAGTPLPSGWPASVGSVAPSGWPFPAIPPWLTPLESVEQRFLECCQGRLALEERVLVYLVFYADLDVRQIVCVLQALQPATEAQVIVDLTHCWERFLTCLAGSPG